MVLPAVLRSLSECLRPLQALTQCQEMRKQNPKVRRLYFQVTQLTAAYFILRELLLKVGRKDEERERYARLNNPVSRS